MPAVRRHVVRHRDCVCTYSYCWYSRFTHLQQLLRDSIVATLGAAIPLALAFGICLRVAAAWRLAISLQQLNKDEAQCRAAVETEPRKGKYEISLTVPAAAACSVWASVLLSA